ncbi:hypothetical protein PIB30_015130 [Stylosanthes scabra]|uniref:Uncharacterized protein n=1 Tax=Stylosanthes scabra TaxID=79078 RepID=A0ABU6S6T4_9FABA|nr:hypothetical protein [Stylosanthes scabra]
MFDSKSEVVCPSSLGTGCRLLTGNSAIKRVQHQVPRQQRQCCVRNPEVHLLTSPKRNLRASPLEQVGGCTCKALRCLSHVPPLPYQFVEGGYRREFLHLRCGTASCNYTLHVGYNFPSVLLQVGSELTSRTELVSCQFKSGSDLSYKSAVGRNSLLHCPKSNHQLYDVWRSGCAPNRVSSSMTRTSQDAPNWYMGSSRTSRVSSGFPKWAGL